MEIRFSASASRTLRRSDKRRLLDEKIKLLAVDPLAPNANVKKLKGRDDYRLRVQNWRVVFHLEGQLLHIDEVVPRGSAYED